jgi:anti-anti-sigma factor
VASEETRLLGALQLPDGEYVRGRGVEDRLPGGPLPQFGLYLSVDGDLDIATAEAIRSRGQQLLTDDEVSGLVVDLQNTTFVDSLGLGALIDLRNAAARHAMSFALVNAAPKVRRTIEISGLLSFLKMQSR